jgi:hypothetical protein
VNRAIYNHYAVELATSDNPQVLDVDPVDIHSVVAEQAVVD